MRSLVNKIVIEPVDEATLTELAQRAAQSGRSIAEVAREALLRGLAKPIHELAEAADRARALTPKKLSADESVNIIRRLREG